MTTSIKPIETRYKGYRFRSRLEARWAVFFDKLGWEWDYEAEGFDLGREAGWYLPDFRLTKEKVWVEVKPTLEVTKEDRAKTFELCHQSGDMVIVTHGAPWTTTLCTFLTKPDGPVKCESEHCAETAVVNILLGHLVLCPCCNGIGILGKPSKEESDGQQEYEQLKRPLLSNRVLLNAYSAARSARFEHNERRNN